MVKTFFEFFLPLAFNFVLFLSAKRIEPLISFLVTHILSLLTTTITTTPNDNNKKQEQQGAIS